jgi:hypothetical protein
MECAFTRKYQLPPDVNDMDAIMDRLAEAGCDDALVGVGQPGRLALEFVREAHCEHDAIEGAIEEVRRAVPHACLIEAALAS